MADGEQQTCPLDPQFIEEGDRMGLVQVKAIEQHFKAPGNCVGPHPPLKELILQGSLKGSTPLLLACTYGNVAVVKRMIGKRWKVDVNAAATYYHPPSDITVNRVGDLSTLHRGIEGATPLFVAAANGHVHLVRYLLKVGADVSAKTSSKDTTFCHLTPLHGALIAIGKLGFNPFSEDEDSSRRQRKKEIALLLLEKGADPSALPKCKTPVWAMSLCHKNFSVVSQLIDHGMSLEQKNPLNHFTVLHHWIRSKEESRLVVVKKLVEKGANLKALDFDGLSPLLSVVYTFNSDQSSEDLSIFDYLLERQEINRQKKIDALEVIGAVLLSDPNNSHLFEKAFDYWRRAQHLREMDLEGSGRIFKTVMKRTSGISEWITTDEMEHVIKNPSQHLHQSYLIRFRIYSRKSSIFSELVWTFFSVDVPTLMDVPSNISTLLDLLCAILETNLNRQLEEFVWEHPVKKILEILPSLLKDDSIVTTETILTSLELIRSTEQHLVLKGFNYESHYYEPEYDQEDNMQTIRDLVNMLADNPEKLDSDRMRILSALLRLEETTLLFTQDRSTMLILACQDGFSNNLSTVRLLLKCKADPNLGDREGNEPLHHLLKGGDLGKLHKRDDYAILRLFLDFGGRLDRKNKDGKTPVDLWTEFQINNWNLHPEEILLDRLPDWCYLQLPRLKVLSARAVRSNDIPFSEETVPATLCKFVENQEMQ